jgi:hypothetical protein
MSRIDEALRRMSTGPAEQGPRAIAERPARRPEGSVLEIYPAEEAAVAFEGKLLRSASPAVPARQPAATAWTPERTPQVLESCSFRRKTIRSCWSSTVAWPHRSTSCRSTAG